MSQFKALNAALDMLNYPKADHDPRCLSLKGLGNGCNCWSYSYQSKEGSHGGAQMDGRPSDSDHSNLDSPVRGHSRNNTSIEVIPVAALPSVDTTSIEAKHQSFLTGFAMRTKSLNDRVARVGITRTIAEEAQELDTDAKKWLDAFETETKPIKDQLFKAHRLFTGFCEKLSGGATAARQTARKLIGAYQLEQQRIADEKRREAERRAREEAERQRQAEVDALTTEAAEAEKAGNSELAEFIQQEALDAEQAPAIPVSVPEEAPQKIEGASVSYKLVGTVEDPFPLLMFLIGAEQRGDVWALRGPREFRADLIRELMTWNQSGINAALKRGLNLPGVSVSKQAITRNLSGR